jgi:hypothetical protein
MRRFLTRNFCLKYAIGCTGLRGCSQVWSRVGGALLALPSKSVANIFRDFIWKLCVPSPDGQGINVPQKYHLKGSAGMAFVRSLPLLQGKIQSETLDCVGSLSFEGAKAGRGESMLGAVRNDTWICKSSMIKKQ